MKRSMVLMAVIMMLSSTIFAQEKEKHHHRGQHQLAKLKSELSLNETQYASIKEINKKYAAQAGRQRNDSTVSKKDKHIALRNLRAEKQKEINAVLTPDQKTKYETLKAERAAKQKAQRAERVEKRQAKIASELSLTDEQAAKVKDANQALSTKMKQLREKSESAKIATKDEMLKLKKEHEATMQSILSPEQFSKWKEIRKSAEKKSRHGKKKHR